MTEIVVFSQTAIQRPRGAYFVNKHNTFWKEETISFPEHQIFLKSIKNSTRKSKKSRKKLKISGFFGKIENFRKTQEFSTFSLIFRKFSVFFDFFEKFRFSRKIPKISIFFQIFSIFSSIFLWISKNFDVLERKMSPLSRKYHIYLRNMLP